MRRLGGVDVGCDPSGLPPANVFPATYAPSGLPVAAAAHAGLIRHHVPFTVSRVGSLWECALTGLRTVTHSVLIYCDPIHILGMHWQDRCP